MPDLPLAYLITLRCYGTWLHGDARGSIDRRRNQYHSSFIPENERWRAYSARNLKHSPVTLDDRQRTSVEGAIRETCNFRSWILRAVNVRTNHVHVLVTPHSGPEDSSVPSAIAEGLSATPADRVLNALKANATRQMRQDGRWPHKHSPWSDRGSKRFIWTELGLERAMEYVVNGQCKPMPEFDKPDHPE